MIMFDGKVERFSEILKRKRKEQKLTQEQLAGTTGVGIRFVRELENGKESCHLGKSLQVAHMLGISIKVDGKEI